MKEQEIKPLVSDAMLRPDPFWAFNEKYQTDLYHTPPPLTPDQVRDLYEADRAASRLLIEKLTKERDDRDEVVTRQGDAIAVLHRRVAEAVRVVKQAHDAIDTLNDGGMGPLTNIEGTQAMIACSDFLAEANAFLKPKARMIRYMDNRIKTLAKETAWPNFYRKLAWASLILALAAVITLAYAPNYIMR